MKAVFATVVALLTLLGLACVASVVAQVRIIRAERRSDVVRNLRDAKQPR